MSNSTTLAFTVPNMTCGHCVKAITGAVLSAYPGARVDIDLAAKRVSIANAGDQAAVASVIAAAGYSPVEAG